MGKHGFGFTPDDRLGGYWLPFTLFALGFAVMVTGTIFNLLGVS